MFLESDQVHIEFIVKNNLNSTQNYLIDLKIRPISNNSEDSFTTIISTTLEPLEEKVVPFSTYLPTGQSELIANLHVNATNCCHIQGYSTWLIVQPMQDFYNFIGTTVSAYAAAAGVIVTLGISMFNNRKKRIITSVKLTHELNQIFSDPKFDKTRNIIEQTINENKPLLITRDGLPQPMTYVISEKEIDDYLSELELIAMYVNKKALDLDIAYNAFASAFESIYGHNDIRTHIEKSKSEQSDYWNDFEKAVTKFRKYRQKHGVSRASESELVKKSPTENVPKKTTSDIYQKLKFSGRYGVWLGLGLLSGGVFLFMNFDPGTRHEKLGLVLMTYAGIFLAIGYTAWIAWRTKSS